MIRNYKVLGVAVAAMLALSAFAAQAASAHPLTVEELGGATSVWTTGTQEGKTIFHSSGGNVECTETHELGVGSVKEGVNSEQTITPVYNTETKEAKPNCVAFGFAEAHVKVNGCTYTLTTPTKGTGTEPTWETGEKGDVHTLCPTGKSIEITPTFFGASVCTESIGAQTPTSGHIVGKNITDNEKMAVTLSITLAGIHYTGTGSSCGNSETHTDGTLTGSSKVTCFKNELRTEQVGCTFS